MVVSIRGFVFTYSWFFFAVRFLMPHFHWLVITLITGLITAAASGLGVPLMVKFVFPIVFYNGEGELPLLMQYVPSFKEMEHATLLLLATLLTL